MSLKQAVTKLVGCSEEKARYIERVAIEKGAQFVKNLNTRQLETYFSLSPKQAERLAYAFTMSELPMAEYGVQIRQPSDCGHYLTAKYQHLSQEVLGVLCLNAKNFIISESIVYKGSAGSTLLRIAEIFREPILMTAQAIIIFHNHPSGIVNPSDDDLQVTANVVDAGKMLDIDVLDHIIVGNSNWLSLRQSGYWPR